MVEHKVRECNKRKGQERSEPKLVERIERKFVDHRERKGQSSFRQFSFNHKIFVQSEIRYISNLIRKLGISHFC